MDITKSYLSQAEFVALPADKRAKVREVFNVPKSGQVKVASSPAGDQLVSDGTEPQDLAGSLNTQALLKFLGLAEKEAKRGFDALWQEAHEVIFGKKAEAVAPAEVPKAETPKPEPKVESNAPKKIVVSQKKPRAKKK